MKPIYLIVGLATLTISCGTVRNYTQGGKPKIIAEKTTLTISTDSVNAKGLGIMGIVGALAPTAIDLGAKTINHFLKVEEAKYTATYKASNSGQNFYPDEKNYNLPKLKIERMVRLKDEPDDFKPAASITLIPQLSNDGTAFRYILDKHSLKYDYSIAKLKGDHVYIDLYLEIKLRNLTVNSKTYALNDIRTVTMVVPSIKVSKNNSAKVSNDANLPDSIVSGWIPLFPGSLKETSEKEDKTEHKITNKINEKKDSVITEEIIITKNANTKTIPQNGIYEIDIAVTEINMAKLKSQKRAQLFDATNESGAAFLKEIIKLFDKEDEKDESK